MEKKEDDTNENEAEAESPTANSFVDDLTLKLLANQNSYTKYISNTDERAFERRQQFARDCNEHKTDILAITRELCNQPYSDIYSSTITDAFYDYAQTLLRHIQTKKQSDSNQKEYENEADEMFPYTTPSSTLDFFAKNRPIL